MQLKSQKNYNPLHHISEDSKVAAFVGDNTDNFIYIIDPDTYDIIYMNKKALSMYNNPSEDEWRSKKCYELLHGKSTPCEFCTNKYTTEHEFYEWNYFHPKFNKTYLFKDKLVSLNGKLVKLQVATDITKLVTLEKELTNKLDEQSLLFDCIKMLHTDNSPEASINKILNLVGNFFDATTCLIVQISDDKTRINNTHEWTNEYTQSRKHTLQNLPINIIEPFLNTFTDNSAVYKNDISQFYNNNEAGHSMLKSRKITSLIAAPILDAKENNIGIFGVENPSENLDKFWLLGSLSAFISDFLEKNKLVSSLNNLSYYDILTGVKNRHSYRKALTEIDESNVSSLGVAYVDITGLSRINEEKSTQFGDELIKNMASILTSLFADNIFRVGGDEFVILQKNIAELDFESKINELKSIISNEPELNASIGFTWNSSFNDNEEENSENSEYNTVRYSKYYTSMLSHNLEKEIKSGKYVVFLQPQINFKTGELDGAEALIRRIDASGQIQSPIAFVPFYEKEGMISKIDFYVFETVCKLLNDWEKRALTTDIKFSVNFSRSTIMEKNLVDRLVGICEKHGVDKSNFIVEITETISHTDDKVFSRIITSLRNAGFCVSLDDFGSGYANLSALKATDFDEIKIDMNITQNLHIDTKSKILTKVALNLCDEFGDMISVAEGIETKEQRDILEQLNCNKGQGYFFSRPISIADFEKKYLVDVKLK